jgi:predicted nucleotidyltransferase
MPVLTMREPEREILADRKTALIEKAQSAGRYLKELGATEVYLFGSITRDDFHPHSDVDIAVSGLPYKRIYSVEARIADILGTDDFDLV